MPNNKPEDTLSPSVIQYQTLPYGWVNREIHQQINMMKTIFNVMIMACYAI